MKKLFRGLGLACILGALLLTAGCARKCATDDDCLKGRCNKAVKEGVCQEINLGEADSPCSENAFCKSRFCDAGKCAAECAGQMWFDGTDCLKKGEGGAKCTTGDACMNGRCEGGWCFIECPNGESFEEGKCMDPRHVDWVKIVGGHFSMGSDELKAYPDEKPVHEVSIRTFEIARNEVTVGQYRKCVQAGACTEPATDKYCNWDEKDREQHPINCVDWDQATAYAKWVGGRLPTEAEWEFAARGTTGNKWPWGTSEATCRYAVISDGGDGCGRERTWPVCSKASGNTPEGICDMSGNVLEWVQDTYHERYTNAPSDGSAWIDDDKYRMTRGGSWYSEPRMARATVRVHYEPAKHLGTVGFRVARDAD